MNCAWKEADPGCPKNLEILGKILCILIYQHLLCLFVYSQFGNWSSFRNTVLDGKKVIIDLSWFSNIDSVEGELEFDFILQHIVPKDSIIVTNSRLCNLLVHLHIIDSAGQMIEALDSEDYVIKETISGHLVSSKWKTDHHCAYELYKQLEWCYEHYDNRDSEAVFSAQYLEDSVLLSLGSTAGESPSKAVASSTVKDAPIRKGRFIMRVVAPKKKKEKEVAKVQLPKAKNYSLALKAIQDNSIIDREIVSIRTIDALEDALAGRYITCCQLAAIIKVFPGGNLKRNNFGTMRIELIISFYSYLIDIVNFNRVFRLLTPHEMGMLVFRMGWLNIWCPIFADGAFILNFSRYEEKQMIRIFLVLDNLEKSRNMTNIVYLPQGVNEKLTIKHATESPLRKSSILVAAGDVSDGSQSPPKSPKKMSKKSGSVSSLGINESPPTLVDSPTQIELATPLDSSDEIYDPIIEAEEVDDVNEVPNETELALEAQNAMESIPPEWLIEDGLPSVGCLMFDYECSSNESNNKARVNFSSLTLPQAIFSRLITQPTVMNVEEQLSDTPYRFAFLTDQQHKSIASLPVLTDENNEKSKSFSGILGDNASASSPSNAKFNLKKSILKQRTYSDL